MATTNILFPPIVPTYQPVVIIGAGVTSYNIYFALSEYNTLSDIKNVQLTITNQKTNLSMLKKRDSEENPLYPTGIKVYAGSSIGTVSGTNTNYNYYITLDSSDLTEDFKINQYYKIQLRFGTEVPPENTASINTWLVTNATNCSEWSTVTLFYGISQPSLTINSFTTSNNQYVYESLTLNLIGSVTFADEDDTENLKSYRCRLYKNNQCVGDSGEVYSNEYSNTNEINYTFKYLLENSSVYRVIVDITTRNLFSQSYTYDFTISQSSSSAINGTLTCTGNADEGCIEVSLVENGSSTHTGDITFKRASSRSNFTVWEDIKTLHFEGSKYTSTWKDYTIESGIWYKYSVQTNNEGIRGSEIFTADPAISLFDSTFLLKDNIQLRIRYNPKVTTFKRSLTDAKIETIGSRYPYIKRSGMMDYYNIAISGLITMHDDYEQGVYENLFMSREDIYGGSDILNLYTTFNEENSINDWNDFVLEREFRKHVIEYLHKDSATLLRTPTEGNFLVRLTDVSLTPEDGLGRKIYTFSANTYEIDDCTIENLDKYNIIKIKEE